MRSWSQKAAERCAGGTPGTLTALLRGCWPGQRQACRAHQERHRQRLATGGTDEAPAGPAGDLGPALQWLPPCSLTRESFLPLLAPGGPSRVPTVGPRPPYVCRQRQTITSLVALPLLSKP